MRPRGLPKVTGASRRLPAPRPPRPRRARRTWHSVIQKCTLGSMRAAPRCTRGPARPRAPSSSCVSSGDQRDGRRGRGRRGGGAGGVPRPGRARTQCQSAARAPAAPCLHVPAPRAPCFRNPVPPAHPRCPVSPDVPAPGARRACCSVSPPSNAPRSHTYTPCPRPGAPTIPVSPPLPQIESSPRCMATPWVHRSPVSQPPPQLWT